MDTSTNGAIIVGVTGPGREEAALRFAAESARREGAEVVLVHAFHVVTATPPPTALMTYAEAADVAQRIVKEVGAEFDELTGGTVEFRTRAVSGTPTRVLVDLSRGARMVVVQHRHTDLLGRIFVGSTVNGAAAHADCPVISVNPEWQPGEVAGEVVIGLHEGGQPPQVLEAGFAWAVATHAPVRLVHAWRLDAAYDDLIAPSESESWADKQKRALAAAAEDLERDHPDIEVIVEVRHQWPADVLVDDARTASLVVVGRHDSRRWTPERLGSIARTVLREATCPVMVVPLRRTPDDWGLDPDEISPQA